jgi:hypothetical protein
MPNYYFTCGRCEEEGVSAVKLAAVQCGHCKTTNRFPPNQWYAGDMENDPGQDYDDQKDRYKFDAQLWGDFVTRTFNINMRLDGAFNPASTVGGIVMNRPTQAQHKKKTLNAFVSDVKGGRQGGGVVMGAAARVVSGRGNAAFVHQDEEWLHLWGDNLGGPSQPNNFVAGSYAANTEMLVIEQALAKNAALTRGLHISVTAYCNLQHVGEYVSYKLRSPTGGNDFKHVIDLNNRVFAQADVATVSALVNVWLLANGLLVT